VITSLAGTAAECALFARADVTAERASALFASAGLEAAHCPVAQQQRALGIVRADEIDHQRARHQIGQRGAEQVEIAAAQRDGRVREGGFLPLDLDLDFLGQVFHHVLVNAVLSFAGLGVL